MSDIVVKENRHIAEIATLKGFADWHTLWEENTALKEKRQNPLILFHGDKAPTKWWKDGSVIVKGNKGDVVELKPITPKEVAGGTNEHHSFNLAAEDVLLRLRVLGEDFKPLKDATYALFVDGVTYPKPPDKDTPADNKIPANGLIETQVWNLAQVGKLVVQYTPPEQAEAKDWPKDIQGVAGGDDVGTYGLQTIYHEGRNCPHFARQGSPWTSGQLKELAHNRRWTALINEQRCAVCCVAMVLKYFGRDVTPATLEQHLALSGGFSGFRILWDKAYACMEADDLPKLIQGDKMIGRPGGMNAINTKLDNRIKQNLPTIAHVDTDDGGKGNHYVVIVGKASDGYFMNDPKFDTSRGDGANHPSEHNTLKTTGRVSGYEIKELLLLKVVPPATPDVPPTLAKRPSKPLPLTPPEAEAKAKAEAEAKKVTVTFQLQIGRLDPIGDPELAPDDKCISGIQQRLNNIAFDAGNVDGVLGDHAKAAIKRFQRRFKMPKVDGEPSRDMQHKLRDFYEKEGGTAPPLT